MEETRRTNRLNISNSKGLVISIIGIFLLVVSFIISLFLGTPNTLGGIEGWYNTIRVLYISQFLGLVITFSGIVIMINSFHNSWKTAINKVYEKLKWFEGGKLFINLNDINFREVR